MRAWILAGSLYRSSHFCLTFWANPAFLAREVIHRVQYLKVENPKLVSTRQVGRRSFWSLYVISFLQITQHLLSNRRFSKFDYSQRTTNFGQLSSASSLVKVCGSIVGTANSIDNFDQWIGLGWELSHSVNNCNLSWILEFQVSESDLGYKSFRRTNWRFPFFWNDHIDPPNCGNL